MRGLPQAFPAPGYSSDPKTWVAPKMGPDIALIVLVAIFTVLSIADAVSVWRVEAKATEELHYRSGCQLMHRGGWEEGV